MPPEVGDPFNLRPACPDTEYSVDFLQGMVNRMSVSFYKYGEVAKAYPDKVNALESLQARINAYLETGNLEFLIDAANFCQIEFMCPSNPEAFFKATDSDASPGRIWQNGEASFKRNEEV